MRLVKLIISVFSICTALIDAYVAMIIFCYLILIAIFKYSLCPLVILTAVSFGVADGIAELLLLNLVGAAQAEARHRPFVQAHAAFSRHLLLQAQVGLIGPGSRSL